MTEAGGGNKAQVWRGVSGVPGLGLSVPFSHDTSGSVLNLWEEEKRPRNLWRSIKLWKGWGKEKGGGSGQQADDGIGQQAHVGGHHQQARGRQVEVVGGQVGGIQPVLASHSCRHGKLKDLNKQVGVSSSSASAASAAGAGGHRPVRPLLSLPAYWQNQTGGGVRSCSVATQTSPQVASHKRLQRSSASSSLLIPPNSSGSNNLQIPSRNNLSRVEAEKSSDILSSLQSTKLGSPMVELPLQNHSLLKREPSAHPTNAALRRLSSGQAQAVPPPLPPRLSLSQMASMPAGQKPNMLASNHVQRIGENHQRIGETHQRIGETHPRLARLSSSHQPSLPRILSSVHDGRGGEESSDLGGSLSSTGSVQGEVPFRSRQDSLYSMGFSDICSPLTEVEPDYSTDNSDDDDKDEDDEEGLRVGAMGHEDGNIYEQVLNCRRPSIRLQLPPLPLPLTLPPPSQPKTPCPSSTPLKMKQELGGVKMWAQGGGEVIEEEGKGQAGLRWKARQLKESLSAKFSVRVFQLKN